MGATCSCLQASELAMMREDQASDIISILVEDPTRMHERFGEHDMPLLGLAAQHDRFSLCRWLLARGHDIAARDGLGRTPLHIAVQHNSLYALREMIQHLFRTGSIRVIAQLLDMKCSDGRGILSLSTYRPPASSVSQGVSGTATTNPTPVGARLVGGSAYRATPSDAGLIDSTDRSPGADSLQYGTSAVIDEGSSDDESGVFSGDAALEEDLERVAFDESAADAKPATAPSSSGCNGGSATAKGKQPTPRRAPVTSATGGGGDVAVGMEEEAPDDVVLHQSSTNSNPRSTASVSDTPGGLNSNRMNISEPIIATGAPTFNYLLSVDHPPSTNPRHHAPALVHHFVKVVRRYVRRTVDGGGNRSHPILHLCATGRNLSELVPHSFLAPSMFLDRRIRLVELEHLVTSNNLDRDWASIMPDVNLSYRAVFGIVSAPVGTPIHTPRSRKRHRQLLVHDTLLTPLLVAVYCGCIGVVKHLIILGGRSQIIVSDTCGNNVVHYAIDHLVRTGSDRMLRFVLRYLKECEDLIYRTNSNGHRPGEFNADEAADLELMDASFEPLATIPSAASFKHRKSIAAAGLAPVPTMSMMRSGSSPTAAEGLPSPTAPPVRSGTQGPREHQALRQKHPPGSTMPDGGEHHLAESVKKADELIFDALSSGSEEESDEDSPGPVDEKGAPIRRSGRNSNLGAQPSATPTVNTTSTSDTVADSGEAGANNDVTDVDEEGRVTTVGSVRRGPKRNRRQQQQPPQEEEGVVPGMIPDADDEVAEDGDGPAPAPPQLLSAGYTGAGGTHTPRNFGAHEGTGGRSPALGVRNPDRNVLPCLRTHPLRVALHLE